jgi:phage baseplate assembly protein W
MNQTFLGIGWSFPPTFDDQGAAVEMVAGAEDISQSLQILFSTAPGERVMQESYGCDLQSLLFEEADTSLSNRITVMITDAILFHEPRITVDQLNVSRSPADPGLLLIALFYTIKSTNSRYNMVFPYYINEATSVVTP